MNTESGNNDSGVSGSVSDEPRDSGKPVLPRHGNVIHKFHNGKQVANCVRKMSAMPEEEDIVSDDTESNVTRNGRHQKHSEVESTEWSSEERGHLLNSARRIIVAPSAGTDAVRRTIASRDDSPENVVRNGSHRPRWPRSRPLTIDLVESRSSSGRDNGIPQSPGGLSFRSIDQPYLVRHHHCLNARSPRISNSAMDESQLRCSCCHQSPTWPSILYSDSNGSQVPRSFPDTISIKSLASIGLGSSDGRKLTIRRVPTSPSELLNVVHPPP